MSPFSSRRAGGQQRRIGDQAVAIDLRVDLSDSERSMHPQTTHDLGFSRAEAQDIVFHTTQHSTTCQPGRLRNGYGLNAKMPLAETRSALLLIDVLIARIISAD
jgi:hypothetical protein